MKLLFNRTELIWIIIEKKIRIWIKTISFFQQGSKIKKRINKQTNELKWIYSAVKYL